MENKDVYKKVVTRLREAEPKPISETERDRIIGAILAEKKSEKNGNILFSPFAWAENRAIRHLLAAAAIVVGAIFLWQQITINGRVKKIESYMVNASVGNIGGRPDQIMPSRVLMSGLSMGVVKRDSILVSSDDMLALIKALEAEKDKSALLESLLESYKASIEPSSRKSIENSGEKSIW